MDTTNGHIVALTGATGYLGRCLAEHFLAAGWQVRRLGRNADTREPVIAFRLGERIAPESLRGARALVHCAYDFSLTAPSEISRVNVEGSRILLAAARAAAVERVVYVSSISAFEGCRSLYGRAKLDVETTALADEALVLRPGLIWGEPPGGTFGALVQQVRRSSTVPLIGDGSQPQYLVHRDDLARMIVGSCATETVPTDRLITVAHHRPWPLRVLLEHIAAGLGLRRTFVPIPWRMVWAGLKAAEAMRVPLPFRSDSVVSLVHQNPRPDFQPLARLGTACRPFA